MLQSLTIQEALSREAASQAYEMAQEQHNAVEARIRETITSMRIHLLGFKADALLLKSLLAMTFEIGPDAIVAAGSRTDLRPGAIEAALMDALLIIHTLPNQPLDPSLAKYIGTRCQICREGIIDVERPSPARAPTLICPNRHRTLPDPEP